MSEHATEKKHEPKKYILYRREVDMYNEVKKAGPNAPSVIGLKDFKTFIEDNGIHPLEVANFLKVTCDEVQLLLNNESWIEPHAQNNLLKIIKVPVKIRQYICQFLMSQDGHAGMRNIPKKKSDSTHDL